MSDVPTYLSCVLDDGKLAIAEAEVQGKKLRPHSFVVGDSYNFTPSESGTVVSGNVVFTGGRSSITGTIPAKDTFQFNLVIPEAAGPFTVGNIILYVQSDDGTVFPFIWVALKIPYPKQAQAIGTIGNRFVFQFIEKIINANDLLVMNIIPAEFFSLAGYTTESELPSPSTALFQHFVVQEPTIAPFPFIGVRRSIDNSYWGLPLYFNVSEPFFGVLDGGRAGEPRSPKTSRFFWGGRLDMPPESLKFNYGGWTTPDGRVIGLPLDQTPTYSIGGDVLPDNPGYPGFLYP